jgi:hypothetical protein
LTKKTSAGPDLCGRLADTLREWFFTPGVVPNKEDNPECWRQHAVQFANLLADHSISLGDEPLYLSRDENRIRAALARIREGKRDKGGERASQPPVARAKPDKPRQLVVHQGSPNGYNRGVAYAVAMLAGTFDEPGMAAQIIRESGISLDQFERSACDDFDMVEVRRVFASERTF